MSDRQATFDARAADNGAWEVWDVSHDSESNHFPVVRIDSKGASDDFHESYARVCAAALNLEHPPLHPGEQQ